MKTVIMTKFIALSFLLMIGSQSVLAARDDKRKDKSNGKVQSAISAVKDANKKLSDARRKVGKVSDDDLNRLLSKFSSLSDSDSDGLPDILEQAIGTNLCDSDSDDDGISDGNEIEIGNPPDDDDFDDDDDSNGQEIERTGLISSISTSSVIVLSTEFAIVSTTRFLDRDQNPISLSDFQIGTCAEVEGVILSGTLTAGKLKQKNSDDCI